LGRRLVIGHISGLFVFLDFKLKTLADDELPSSARVIIAFRNRVYFRTIVWKLFWLPKVSV